MKRVAMVVLVASMLGGCGITDVAGTNSNQKEVNQMVATDVGSLSYYPAQLYKVEKISNGVYTAGRDDWEVRFRTKEISDKSQPKVGDMVWVEVAKDPNPENGAVRVFKKK